jgi:hypothetical protein
MFGTAKSTDTALLEVIFTHLVKKFASLFELEVQVHVHKGPLMDLVLSHINRVDVLTCLLSGMHFNIISQSTRRFKSRVIL